MLRSTLLASVLVTICFARFVVAQEPPANPPSAQEAAKPAEVKPAEPTQEKPVEVKPAETKPAEAPAAEATPAETKPAEAKPAEPMPPAQEKKEPEKKEPAVLLPGHSYQGHVFDEGPRQKAYLMPGMAKIKFPVTTKNPEAQKFIEQGVCQLHGFWYFESERSFRQAAALDADCAMAYWGMALSNMENLNRGKEFIAPAVKRKDSGTPREKLYIEALNDYFQADAKKGKERNEKYIKALERICLENPDDIEAKAFLCLQLWKSREGGSPLLSYLAVNALLEEVFRVDPMHPAHHYRVHLWNYNRDEKARISAGLCGQSAPGIAHMWHMSGHTYSELKRYPDAVYQQEASARVDHAHMMRDGVMPDQIHNFAHNNEWLIRNLSKLGRVRDGIDLAKNMIELPRHPKYNSFPGSGSSSFGRSRLTEMLSRFELWDELLQLANTAYLEPHGDVKEQARRARMIGEAYFRKGRKDQGVAQLAEVRDLLQKEKEAQTKAETDAENKVRMEKKDDPNLQKLVDDAKKGAAKPFEDKTRELQKAIDELEGHEAVFAGDMKKGFESLKKAGGVEATYLNWVRFKSGEKEEAEKAARDHIRNNRNEVLPLAALVEILWASEKRLEAAKEFNQLRELSQAIDIDVPPFARLAPIAKELGLPDDWRIAKQFANDTGVRPELATLGPLRWKPSVAGDFRLPDWTGRASSLSEFRGKPVVVVFYLGSGCLHCAEQLTAFSKRQNDFRAAGLEWVAISSDDLEGLKVSHQNYNDGLMPIPLLSDPTLQAFKSFRCYDDFENVPLHGTFLIDPDGAIRWQDINAEPFKDVDFLIKESKRLLSFTHPPQPSLVNSSPVIAVVPYPKASPTTAPAIAPTTAATPAPAAPPPETAAKAPETPVETPAKSGGD
jgi:peroxiredoxin